MTTKTKLAVLLLAVAIAACNAEQRALIEIASGGAVSTGNWLKLVGQWQDAENPDFIVEFRSNGTFVEYLFGEQVGFGDFVPDGPLFIRLDYRSTCGGPNQISCTVTLRYDVTGSLLTITDSQGDLAFRKVGE